MKIRRGKLTDWKEMLKILNGSKELQGFEEGKTYTPEWVKDSLQDKERNYVLVIDDNKKIVGFLIAEIWRKKRYSFFADMFIELEYRGKGLASKLFGEYEKYCKEKKLRSIIGLVLKENFRMQEIMEKKQYKKGSLLYYYEKRLK